MKLLINFLQSNSGGARSYFRNILPYISQWHGSKHVSVYVLMYKRQIEADNINLDGLKFQPVIIDDVPKYFKPLAEQLIVKDTIRRLSIDTLFTPYQVAYPFAGVKTVSMIRNMEAFLHWQYPSTLRNRIRNIVLQALSVLTLKKSDLVIAVSDFAKDYLINHLNITPDKIVRIYHGRDQRFNPIKQDMDDLILNELMLDSKSYIFTNGSILPYRRLEVILKAFAKSKAMHNYKLVVAGDSNDLNYKNIINNIIAVAGLEDKVVQLGFVDIEKIIVLYRHAKVFVTATEIEACPNIAIEAMASNSLVIASDKSPLPEMFQNNATYFKTGDFEDLADKLDCFLDNYPDSECSSYDVERFSWQNCADNTFGVICQFN